MPKEFYSPSELNPNVSQGIGEVDTSYSIGFKDSPSMNTAGRHPGDQAQKDFDNNIKLQNLQNSLVKQQQATHALHMQQMKQLAIQGTTPLYHAVKSGKFNDLKYTIGQYGHGGQYEELAKLQGMNNIQVIPREAASPDVLNDPEHQNDKNFVTFTDNDGNPHTMSTPAFMTNVGNGQTLQSLQAQTRADKTLQLQQKQANTTKPPTPAEAKRADEQKASAALQKKDPDEYQDLPLSNAHAVATRNLQANKGVASDEAVREANSIEDSVKQLQKTSQTLEKGWKVTTTTKTQQDENGKEKQVQVQTNLMSPAVKAWKKQFYMQHGKRYIDSQTSDYRQANDRQHMWQRDRPQDSLKTAAGQQASEHWVADVKSPVFKKYVDEQAHQAYQHLQNAFHDGKNFKDLTKQDIEIWHAVQPNSLKQAQQAASNRIHQTLDNPKANKEYRTLTSSALALEAIAKAGQNGNLERATGPLDQLILTVNAYLGTSDAKKLKSSRQLGTLLTSKYFSLAGTALTESELRQLRSAYGSLNQGEKEALQTIRGVMQETLNSMQGFVTANGVLEADINLLNAPIVNSFIHYLDQLSSQAK